MQLQKYSNQGSVRYKINSLVTKHNTVTITSEAHNFKSTIHWCIDRNSLNSTKIQQRKKNIEKRSCKYESLRCSWTTACNGTTRWNHPCPRDYDYDYDYDDDFLLNILIEILTEMAHNHPDSATVDEDQLILMLLKELQVELQAEVESGTADGLTHQLMDITNFLTDTFTHIVELKENIPDSTDTLKPSTSSKADDVLSTSGDKTNLSSDERTLKPSTSNTFTVESSATELHSIIETSDVAEPSVTLQSRETYSATESSSNTGDFSSSEPST